MKPFNLHMFRPMAPVGSRRSVSGAFTLIELVIVVAILGILAALVIPRFSNATQTARSNALREDLRNLRTQITVYRAHHLGIGPGATDSSIASAKSASPSLDLFVAQLTQYTDEKGATSAKPSSQYRLGPYLLKVPVNPINDSSEILFIESGQPFPTKPTGKQGWVYQPSTGTIAANVAGTDSSGVAYFDY